MATHISNTSCAACSPTLCDLLSGASLGLELTCLFGAPPMLPEFLTTTTNWPGISDLERCHFPFPGIRFRFPFSPYPPFSLFPGNVSAFFCKIHKLPVILCHFPQFRQNSVKFAAKNARFAERSAKFRKNPEISKKTCKITQKFALERCEGVTIL